MSQAIVNSLWCVGGYVLAVFTWDKVHTFFVGAEAKIQQLRDKVKSLQADVKAKL